MELKRLFAEVALGDEHIGDLAFYSNIHEKAINDKSACQKEAGNNSTAMLDSTDMSEMRENEPQDNKISSKEIGVEDTETQVCLKTEFEDITDDYYNGSKEIKTYRGLKKCIYAYRSLLCGPAPSAALATALYHFGRNYSKQNIIFLCRPSFLIDTPWSLRRFGKHIPVQSTALKRRRHGIPKGINQRQTTNL